MQPGTPGTWDGEKWIPLDHEQLRAMVVDILIRDVSPVLELPRVRQIVRGELATHMAAALADPDLGHTPEGDARRIYGHLRESGLEPRQANGIGMALAASRKETAKGIAGYLLERLGNQEPGTV